MSFDRFSSQALAELHDASGINVGHVTGAGIGPNTSGTSMRHDDVNGTIVEHDDVSGASMGMVILLVPI